MNPKLDFFEKTPGPGAYELAKATMATMRSPQRASLSGRTNMFAVNYSNPAPTQYTPRNASDGPKASFGRPHRCFKHKPTPGPGAYDLQLLKDEIAASMSSRFRIGNTPKKQPGPGDYTVKLTQQAPLINLRLQCPRSAGFSGQRQTPGPAAYSERPRSGGVSFSLQSRRPAVNHQRTPGPGQYTIQGQAPQKGLTMSGRVKRGWAKY